MTAAMPFAGINVLDFTWGLAGPLTTKYLADYGATVVRVESARRPCGCRVSPPYMDGEVRVDRSGYFAFYNANKLSLGLDMNHPRAGEVVARLIDWADVMAESYSPGTMEKWGLDYESVKRTKPDIIMMSSSSQGQYGPHAGFSAFGIPIVGLSGFSHFTGWPEGTSLPLPSAYTDMIGPRFAATALIAALDCRRRTGEGRYIDCSQFESAIHFLAPAMLDCTFNGRDGERAGNASPHACPHGVYRCRGEDRWCAIAVFNDRQWESLGRCMGGGVLEDKRFSTLLNRKRHVAELEALIDAWTSQLSSEEVMDRLQAVGVPCGKVQTSAELRNDPQLLHRGCYWEMEHPVLGRYPHLGQPATLSETPASARLPAPCLGQDAEYVCTMLLGMQDEEFVDLLGSGMFAG